MDKGIADRVLVIGIDGATFDLLDPWVEAGELPNIASLIQNGVRGRLSSVLPINSVAGWASFATGMNPGKHGLYDFKVRKEGSYETELVDINMLEKPTLWEILSAYGKRVGVINVPICYPPQETNGFMISGMLAPSTKVTYTYPPELAEEIEGRVGGYQMDVDYPRFERGEVTREIFLEEIKRLTDIRRKTILFLMKEYPWDFLLAVFTGTDRMQHFFWGYSDPSHPHYQIEDAKELRVRFKGFFRFLDGVIGEIVANAGEGTVKILVSDHGFGPLYKRFYLNKWLYSLGLLFPRGREDLERYRHRAHELLARVDRFDLRRRLLSPRVRGKLRPTTEIDWSRTRAYVASQSDAGIFINLKGREPQGIVQEGEEYEELCRYLSETLLRVLDPETKEPIVERVFRATEVCWGDNVSRLPDLIVRFRDDECQIVESILGPSIIEPARERSGSHRMDGILIVSGPNVRKDVEIEKHSLMDIAPTVLHLFGLPVPEEMDGQVVEEAFSKPYEIQYTSSVLRKRGKEPGFIYSEEEEREVEKRLRGLGYID